MLNLKLNRIQAVNYSTVMDAVSYSQKSLKALRPYWDDLFFNREPISERLAEASEMVGVPAASLETSYNKVLSSLRELPLVHSIITIKDSNYPSMLRGVKEPPLFLFVRGIPELFDLQPCVAVVGSREASEEGRRRAQKLSVLLANNGHTVVSGLAKGIDTAALSSAIKTGGKTIAVIGTRLDQYYPAENVELQDKIGRGHLLVSQFPYAQPITKWNFPQRNYTMMGLTKATIIVEAGETSGALIQARFCLQENRQLFVMKSLLDTGLKWPHTYVKRGGIVLEDIDQLMEKLREVPDSPKPAEINQQLTLFA